LRTDTADPGLVQRVTLAALARETAHRVLAPSIAAYARELDALVDVLAVGETGSLRTRNGTVKHRRRELSTTTARPTFGHSSVNAGVPRRGQVSLLPRDISVPPPHAFPMVEQQHTHLG